MTISPLIMVQFEKFKNWHTQESKPVLQGGLDPIFVRPHVLLSVSGGRTGSIWNTVRACQKNFFRANFSLVWILISFGAHKLWQRFWDLPSIFVVSCDRTTGLILIPRQMGIPIRLKLARKKFFCHTLRYIIHIHINMNTISL